MVEERNIKIIHLQVIFKGIKLQPLFKEEEKSVVLNIFAQES